MANDKLTHHGVLGQKWGVRRTPEQLGHRVNRTKVANKKLSEKKAKLSSIASKHAVKTAKYEKKYSKKMLRARDKIDENNALKYKLKADKERIKLEKSKRKIQRYDKKINKNKVLIKNLNLEIKKMKKESLEAGKKFVKKEESLKKGN